VLVIHIWIHKYIQINSKKIPTHTHSHTSMPTNRHSCTHTNTQHLERYILWFIYTVIQLYQCKLSHEPVHTKAYRDVQRYHYTGIHAHIQTYIETLLSNINTATFILYYTSAGVHCVHTVQESRWQIYSHRQLQPVCRAVY